MDSSAESPSTIVSPPTPSLLKPLAALSDSTSLSAQLSTVQQPPLSRKSSESEKVRSATSSLLAGSGTHTSKDLIRPGLSRQSTWSEGKKKTNLQRLDSNINWDEFTVKPLSSEPTSASSRVGEVTRLHEALAKNNELVDMLERIKSKSKARIDTLTADLADRTNQLSLLRSSPQINPEEFAQAIKDRDEARAQLARAQQQSNRGRSTSAGSDQHTQERIVQLEAENAKLAQIVAEKSVSTLRVAELTRQVEQLEAERNSMRARVQALESDRAEVVEVARSRSRKSSVVASPLVITTNAESSSMSARELEHVVRQLEAKLAARDASIAQLRSSGMASGELEELKVRLAVAEVAARGAVRELLDLRKERELSDSPSAGSTTTSPTTTQADQASPALLASESQLAKLSADLDRVDRERKKLVGTLELAQRQADKAATEKRQLETEIGAMQKSLEEERAAGMKLEEEVQQLRDAYTNLERESQRDREKNDSTVELQSRVTVLQRKLEVEERERKALEAQLQDAYNRLESARPPSLDELFAESQDKIGQEAKEAAEMNDWFEKYDNELLADLANLRCVLASAELRTEQLAEEVRTLTDAEQDYQLRLTEAEMARRSAENDLLDLKESIEREKRVLETPPNVEESLLTSRNETDRLTAELEQARAEIQSMTVTLDKRSKEITTISAQLASEMEENLASSEAKILLATTKSELALAEGKIATLAGKNKTLEAEISDSRRTISQLQKELTAARDSQAAQLGLSDSAWKRVAELESQLEESKKTTASLAQELTAAQAASKEYGQQARAASSEKLLSH
ncbi:hypothetical protein HDU93_000817, partial [Gonapodya sp. JEL0774]